MERVGGSHRDAAGFVYRRDGALLRQVNRRFSEDFDYLTTSGLYDSLIADRLVVPHTIADVRLAATESAYQVLRPTELAFISYPYEWCFSQLKEAALLTLELQRRALGHGMTLRDASAYNIQFHEGRGLLIDSLSFARYVDGVPWVAYRQFCEHFLGPLALIARRDVRLGRLHAEFPDGVPLDLTSKLLDAASYLSLGLGIHLHAHARAQRHYGGRSIATVKGSLSLSAQLRLVDHLQQTVESLQWNPAATTWASYVDTRNYSETSMASKTAIVTDVIRRVSPRRTWDLGANTGEFSRIAASHGGHAIAMDSDPGAVEINYRALRSEHATAVLPLVVDIVVPSPASGWALDERHSLLQRGPADLVLALALMHHLTLSANVPISAVASLFARMGRRVILEYVPMDDPQAQRLVTARREVAHPYTRDDVLGAMQSAFRVIHTYSVADSDRELWSLAARD